jgi:HK97 family phage major capsid protein
VLNENNDPSNEVEQMSEVVEAPAVIEAASMPIYAQPKTVKMPTAAEWISCALKGGPEFAQMQANIRAAAPNVTTADSDGLLPEILVQPVYNNFRGLRPVIDAIGPRAIPQAGHTFRLPYVSTHNTVALQSAENATLQASTYVVSAYDVNKVTYGGYVQVSEQDLDFSSPEVTGLLLDDMSRIYANATDNAVADALLAAVSQSAVLTDPTSAAEWVSDIYDASVTILNNSNGNLPTHLFLSPNMFGYLGKLVDTAGRPLFPQIGPMNAFGTMAPGMANGAPTAFGLTVVVDRNFAADTVIVGDPSGYFVGEQQKGAISIDNPSTLSRTIAFRGYLAQQMVDATKFVKLT